MLQGDHGNIAFRNIRFATPEKFFKNETAVNPIIVNAEGKPYLLRSFLNYGEKKLTHVISVGNPNQLNYSYDLKQGALFQIWRGEFLDVTQMWRQRGEPQLAKPLGAVIVLSDAPALALLENADQAWPDSVAFDDFQNKGYTLDANKFPSFEYSFNGISVTDKISALEPTSLVRKLKISDAQKGLYLRLAAAVEIASLGNGLYAIGNKNYYITTLVDSQQPMIRKSKLGKELIVAIPAEASTYSYSITW
jgi:hypothetical protein